MNSSSLAAKDMGGTDQSLAWGKWFGRVMTEKVPGSDETYGMRIDAIKKAMNAQFKETWTKAQYKEYRDWNVDPNEIEDVPGHAPQGDREAHSRPREPARGRCPEGRGLARKERLDRRLVRQLERPPRIGWWSPSAPTSTLTCSARSTV